MASSSFSHFIRVSTFFNHHEALRVHHNLSSIGCLFKGSGDSPGPGRIEGQLEVLKQDNLPLKLCNSSYEIFIFNVVKVKF